MTAGCLEIIRSPPETARKQKPIQKREVLAERQMNQGRFVFFQTTVRLVSQLISSEIESLVIFKMMLFVEGIGL